MSSEKVKQISKVNKTDNKILIRLSVDLPLVSQLTLIDVL